MLATVALIILVGADAHGFVIVPPPRNAVDNNTPLFAGGKFPLANGKPGCAESSSVCGCWCSNGTSPCEPGQSCFFFSQGCSIGCPSCDGKNARLQKDLCGNGAKPTICDRRLRTYNIPAECDTKVDKYKHNPWRAPGTAPIFDACGKAGGGEREGCVGSGAAFFTDTEYVKGGDLGSQVLPEMPSGTVWYIGQEAETMWGIRANHGGGYQYRLCPKSHSVTEECFKKMPLPFTGKQSILYRNGTRQRINSKYAYANGTGVFTADGGVPGMGAWALNPIPDTNQGDAPGTKPGVGLEFPAPCDDDASGPTKGVCSGERPFHISIIDEVKVPEGVAPGEYVLGFRWDCEETAQVWSSCSDITIAEEIIV